MTKNKMIFNTDLTKTIRMELEGCGLINKLLKEDLGLIAYLIEDESHYGKLNSYIYKGDVELLLLKRVRDLNGAIFTVTDYYKWTFVDDFINERNIPTIYTLQDQEYIDYFSTYGEDFRNIEFPVYDTNVRQVSHNSKLFSIYFGKFYSNHSSKWRSKEQEIPSEFLTKSNFIGLLKHLQKRLEYFRNEIAAK